MIELIKAAKLANSPEFQKNAENTILKMREEEKTEGFLLKMLKFCRLRVFLLLSGKLQEHF
jgi:hypothetical protein